MVNRDTLIRQWEAEERFPFQGWDFSHLDGRWENWEYATLPWDYRAIVKFYLKDTDRLLDMGTGGGEVLLSIGHPHGNTYATEAYLPNLELCRKVLSPLGITIAQSYEDDKLPFEREYFDCVINRHESFDLTEVNRVLKPGGYFITQQVGNQNEREFEQRLNEGSPPLFQEHTIENYVNALKGMGWRILRTDELLYPIKFFDVGALVYYAKVVPWEFPDFSVKTHLDKLFACQQEIEEKGFLSGTGHRWIIAAQKP